jgi:hypothetical protein
MENSCIGSGRHCNWPRPCRDAPRAETYRATPELADRASEIVEHTAIAIEPEPDYALLEFLDFIRAEIADIRGGRTGNR